MVYGVTQTTPEIVQTRYTCHLKLGVIDSRSEVVYKTCHRFIISRGLRAPKWLLSYALLLYL